MSAIKSGAVSHSRFAKMAEMDYKVSFMSQVKSQSQKFLIKQGVPPKIVYIIFESK